MVAKPLEVAESVFKTFRTAEKFAQSLFISAISDLITFFLFTSLTKHVLDLNYLNQVQKSYEIFFV